MAHGILKAVGGLAGAGIAVFAGTGALDDNTTRNEDGEIVEGGGLGAFAIRTGDCFNDPDADLVMSVEAVRCDFTHDNEVYAEFPLAGTTYPGDAAVEELAIDGCLSRFQGAVGEPYETSALWFSFLTPTRDSWNDHDDREVTCFVYLPDARLVGHVAEGYSTVARPLGG